MCGIVGVLGTHEVAPLILESLKRLEYRGYDSAGIATVNTGRLDRRRAVGKLINLSDLLVHEPLAGKAGIGHTRWATHGEANVKNAHPHSSGPVTVVHNGIIENFRTLREELASVGLGHETDTDTETIALLTRHLMEQGMDPEAAVRETLARLDGAFALAFIFEGHDDLMIGARKGSPLAVGWGDGEMYLGSDAIALAPMTDRITYLDEGDWVVLTRGGATFYDFAGNRVNRDVSVIRLDQTRVDKGGHRHFMAKEIAEQPSVLGAGLAFHLSPDGKTIAFPPEVDFRGIDRVTMVACGTGHYATQVAKYWFEQIAGLPCDTDIASEFRYREPVLSDKGMGIFVSQSGETADTLAALRYVDGKLSRTVGVVNVSTSSIARESDVALPILAGPEISVASTKGFTAQLLVLLLLALKAAHDRGRLDDAGLAEKLAELRMLPGILAQALDRESEIEALAHKISSAKDVLFLGRGVMYPLALEAALKLKELSYIHAEGYASGELKHGPIALIDEVMPVVVLAPRDALYDKTVSNMQEVMARLGKVILISDRKGLDEAGKVWGTLTMPNVPSLIAPIVYAVPAQMLAYHTALARGTDVDQPRNLAKSVTVE
ncbi:glutamine--fructose-6-phosphate transaminase (isomerizing) [Pararhodobacter aggregans]|uniref:Glutamine--fructose-6-phosphate aminotransferase [isomerizing] n=1 Tax=Pararhodobacter aggregans TaxID=404875 RepID=A0A2T7UWR2_9RHOB|nr:glutamine--fructose-6-phosphate transaminase (isomerizing) [Pararhodobacter aggregans]PTX04676.1 glutamine--fructose-6-phosphate transaminase [Pararhodobacter aggregans]PVE49016.1 glutamine--fructose-6-phosphate transaminase (isomerizing) [Pararhodobacter aggregans]